MLRHSLTAAAIILGLCSAPVSIAAPSGIFPVPTESLNTYAGRQQLAVQLGYLVDEIESQYATVSTCPPDTCTMIRNELLYTDGVLSPPMEREDPQIVVYHDTESTPRLRIELRYLNRDVCNLLLGPRGVISQRGWEWFVQFEELRDNNGQIIRPASLSRQCQSSPLDVWGPFLKEMSGLNHIIIYPFPAGRMFAGELDMSIPVEPYNANEPPPPAADPADCELFQQAMSGPDRAATCSYYKGLLQLLHACDPAFPGPDCQAALQCQAAAVSQVGSSTQPLAPESLKSTLAKLSFEQRIMLYEESVWGKKAVAFPPVRNMYAAYPVGFIDPAFVRYMRGKVREIVSQLKFKLSLPTAFQYIWMKESDQEELLQAIADIVWLELGVRRLKIGFDYQIDRENWRNTGYFDPHFEVDPSLTLRLGNMRIQGLDPTDDSALKLNVIAVLHEAFHHYQHELVLAQSRCELPDTDVRYMQAHIFGINKHSYIAGEHIEAYRGNPMELTARLFAEGVYKKWQKECPKGACSTESLPAKWFFTD